MHISKSVMTVGVVGLLTTALIALNLHRSENSSPGVSSGGIEMAQPDATDRTPGAAEQPAVQHDTSVPNRSALASEPPAAPASSEPSTQTAAASPVIDPVAYGLPPDAEVLVVNPTPEQNAAYETLVQRLDDPSFVVNMNLAELSQMQEFAALPDPMKLAIMSKAMDRYNRGEVSRETFFATSR